MQAYEEEEKKESDLDTFEPKHFGAADVEAKTKADVLMLGDDGRMKQLLSSALREVTVANERNLLEAVVRLSSEREGMVLINAEESARKTYELVRALREVSPESMIVLYGDAYAEVFCDKALQGGAADFLAWPIRATEMRTLWRKTQRRKNLQIGGLLYGHRLNQENDGLAGIPTSPSMEMAQGLDSSAGELMIAYQHLAYLVPQGVEILTAETEKLLAQVLRVDRITIKTSGIVEAKQTTHKARYDDKGKLVAVKLFDLHGSTGEMILGSPTEELATREALALQAGQLVGTLLHLSQRDAGLRRLAITDGLTGAYNRRYLEHFVEQVISHSEHEPTQMTLLLFDIDEFKHYNDTYGHPAGDEILREIYVLMRRCCRAHDVVARLGGDEFVVLFWDTGERRERFDSDRAADSEGPHDQRRGPDHWNHDEMVTFMSNRFRRIVQTNSFPMLGSEARGALSISGGLASYPEGGKTLEELLATADAALLDAKRSGKNKIGLFDEAQQQQQSENAG